MTAYATSADGTRIAFDRLGDGPPLLVIGGMFCGRATTRATAEAFADGCTVINFDRRGRGESDEASPYAVRREIEDLEALIDELGGSAAVYGHSSGAGLALRGAAAGLSVTRLILHDAPYGPDDETSRQSSRQLGMAIRSALDGHDAAEALRLFFRSAGMPEAAAEGMAGNPYLLKVAPTMRQDIAAMDFDGGRTIPVDMVARLTMPTLVVAGGNSAPFFQDTARRLAAMLPNATLTTLDGQGHEADPAVSAPVIIGFVSEDESGGS